MSVVSRLVVLTVVAIVTSVCLVMAENAAGQPQTKTDLYGDPLPPGAVARVGSTRLPDAACADCIAFSPDSRLLAAGSGTGDAAMWDVATGKKVWHTECEGGGIYSIAFSPKGDLLAVGNGGLLFYDSKTGRKVGEIERFGDSVSSLTFSPDGSLLAIAGTGGKVWIRDAVTQKEFFQIQDNAKSIAFSLDGKALVLGGNDGAVRVFDMAERKIVFETAVTGRWVRSVAVSPDGKLIASCADYDGVRLRDAVTGVEVRALGEKNHCDVWSVAFSPDGKMLATAEGEGRVVRVWDVSTGDVKHLLPWQCFAVEAVAFSPDGKILAGAGFRIVLWDAVTGKELLPELGCGDVNKVSFSPDGKWLATAQDKGFVRIWDTVTGKPLKEFKGCSDRVTSLAFSSDGHRILLGVPGSMRVWDIAGGEVPKLDETAHVRVVGFSPDGKIAVVERWEQAGLFLLDAVTGEQQCRLDVETGRQYLLAFSPDGKLLAVKTFDWLVRVWDVATGSEYAKFVVNANKAGIECVAFSPDGKKIAAAGQDGIIRLWDVKPGTHIHPVGNPEHVGEVMIYPDGRSEGLQKPRPFEVMWTEVSSIAFSPDSSVIASANRGTVHLWDVATGKELVVLKGHSYNVNSVQFSPDGSLLATGGNDGQTLIWDVRSVLATQAQKF